ncbi:hypothetical protein HX92_3219 [Mycobacterium tuberculosis]|nr:hypothetical protein TMDG_01127 [Mycobacterium tuberculosis SUMu004]KAF3408485.1 hypothetical protein BIT18_1320 [Mycobacterium tuberculosis variant bovis]KAF3410995.1 hypothetical protein BIT17_2693 [Mycobacterium tuberculosis variant bovis]KAF3412525.1 hypothetical protein BIS44_3367 [Mycobacterium tuberculosis variant bovis BCG]KQL79045.1 hypothetical protein HX92_3219 [Mycobacterium tuberculosis]
MALGHGRHGMHQGNPYRHQCPRRIIPLRAVNRAATETHARIVEPALA